MQANSSSSLDPEQTKSPFQSKTILGGIATIVPLLVIAAGLYGVDLKDQAGALASGLGGVVGLVGTIMVIVGRFKATQQIGSGRSSIGDGPLMLLLALGFALTCLTTPLRAQSTPAFEGDPAKDGITDDVTSLVQGISKAHALELALYPTYAPKLANKWGAGLSVMYPLSDHFFTGLRGDLLDGNYFAASASAGLKADYTFAGHVFTPFVLTGVVVPLAHGGAQSGVPGAIVGAGVKTLLWQNSAKTAGLSAFGEAEYWSQYSGVQIYHVGAQVGLSW